MTAGSEPVYGPAGAAGTVPAGRRVEPLHAGMVSDAAGTGPTHGEPLHVRDLDDGPTSSTTAGTLPDTADREPRYVHEQAAGTVTTTVRAQDSTQDSTQDTAGRPSTTTEPPAAPLDIPRLPAPGAERQAAHARTVARLLDGIAHTVAGIPVHALELADGTTYRHDAGHWHPVTPRPVTPAGPYRGDVHPATGPTPVTGPARPAMPSAAQWDAIRAAQQARRAPARPTSAPTSARQDPTGPSTPGPAGQAGTAQRGRQDGPQDGPQESTPDGPDVAALADRIRDARTWWDRNTYTVRREAALMAPVGPAPTSFVDWPQHGPQEAPRGIPPCTCPATWTTSGARMAGCPVHDPADLPADPDPRPDPPQPAQEAQPVPQLAPHVLETLKQAHWHAGRDLQQARRDLELAAEKHERARAHLAETTAREAQLALVLANHDAAIHAEEATRCPACRMTDGRHTGGCAAIAAQLDAYAQEQRHRAHTGQA